MTGADRSLDEPSAVISRAAASIAAMETATPGEHAVKAVLEVLLEEGARLAALMELLRRQRTWSACTWHLGIQHYPSLAAARQALVQVPEPLRAGVVDYATGDAWAEEKNFPFVAAVVSGGVEARRAGDLEALVEPGAASGRGE